MNFIIVGLITALVARTVNRAWVSKLGPFGLTMVAPFLEETLKTGGAVLIGADIFFVHAVFGAAEAVDDINTGARSKSAGVLSFFGHMLFGYLSSMAYRLGGLWWALAAGAGIHILWNVLVLYLVNLKNNA